MRQCILNMTDTIRFSPQIVYIVDKDGIEYPPKSMKDWQYPPEAYVYLRFDNRSYPIARSSIADLAGLTSSPCFKERSYLHIPQGTGDSDFLALYFFLAYGQYPPSLKHLNQALASNEPVSQGPPKIISHDVEAPNHLVWLVTAFQLGKALQYKPFYDFFIKGLYSSHSTAEDPVAVLEKIYKTQRDWDHVTASTSKAPVDAQLREWTKCWLAVRLPALEMAQLGSPYRTNLAVVSMHPSWRARYAQLKASSLELREDDSIANSMFEKTAPAPQPPALPLFQHLMPPQDASNVPMRYSRSNGMPPGQQRASLPSHPGEEGRYFDLSSLSQYLPEDHLQYPRGQTVLSPQPGRGLPDHEAYETLLLSQEERLRNWLRSQISENPYGTFNQQALPDPERPRRPY